MLDRSPRRSVSKWKPCWRGLGQQCRYPTKKDPNSYIWFEYMRDVTCPQCNTRFASRSVKCFCPSCDCAFMRNGTLFGSQAEPLVRDCIRVDFESLPQHDQQWVHYLMTSISLQPNFITDYVFTEMGWSHYLRFMASNSWIVGTGSGLDRAYRLTENGANSLSHLNSDRGPCQSPPACDPQTDG